MAEIDRSFVGGVDINPRMQNIARSILAMAKHIGLNVIAEGIETHGEMEILRAEGYQFFQGYYFSVPRAPDDVADWARAWSEKQCPPAFRKC